MSYVNVYQAINSYLASDNVILWGASSSGLRVLSNLSYFFDISKKNINFYDSNPKKTGETLQNINIISKEEFLDIMNKPKSLCIVASSLINDIKKELDEMCLKNWVFSHGLIYTDKLFDKFDINFLNIYELIKGKSNLDADELFTLYDSSILVKNLPGEAAEVGVYKGGSAYLISSQLQNKKIHLFDTFEGLPNDGEDQLANEPTEGWLDDTSVDEVKSFVLKSGIPEKNLIIHRGYFPKDTLDQVPKSTTFCLVHLDTDRYKSTLEGLEYFYNRLVSGGRIVIHDYNCIGTPGVKLAVDEFLKKLNLSHLLISLSESQAMLIKN